jgi:hypothetical protein
MMVANSFVAHGKDAGDEQREFKMGRNLFLGAVFTVAMLFGASAQAAPVLSSNVDSSVFNSAIGSTTGWSYLGQSTSAFSGSGTAELRYRSATYADSFGFSKTNHTDRTTIFSAGASVGSSASVMGLDPSYLFYFQANGSDFIFFSDDNKQYTDGYASGGLPGEAQGDIDIFFHAADSVWAFFYDDGGGNDFISGDDNDYNDMVVTFAQTTQPPVSTPVPEPGSLALIGLGMIGTALMRRRKQLPTA